MNQKIFVRIKDSIAKNKDLLDRVEKNVYCYIILKDCTQSNITQFNVMQSNKEQLNRMLSTKKEVMYMNIYDLELKGVKGETVSMKEYEGKVLLIVNTATGCGFTPQYEGLQKLYDKYQDKGFEVLDFPCNQFGHQAPGSDEEIHDFCQLRYKTSFPRFSKIDVNGKNADPLFKFLKKNSESTLGTTIKWNFTKFLVDREGNVVKRYAPTTEPIDIDEKIAELLQK